MPFIMNNDYEKHFHLIQTVSPNRLQDAQNHLDSLTKPPGSLGVLEDIARRFAALRDKPFPTRCSKSIYVFAADHGVVAEKISAYPSEVTGQMLRNFIDEGAAINVLAEHFDVDVEVVDIGVDGDFEGLPKLLHRKISKGTANMAKGPAMSRQQAEQALDVGWNLAMNKAREGVDIIGVGDMGIGNTTPSSAILSLYGKTGPDKSTGRGTGIDDATLKRKIEVIGQSIRCNQPNADDPVGVLAKIGGFEIGGIAGMILGCAANRIPVVVDGLVSAAAAMIALKLNPKVADAIFTSHKSVEPGHQIFFDVLQSPPLFDFRMRLGEGTGAVIGINLLEAAAKIYSRMATFQSADISGKENL
jgi:nicotinate-nucleotide--dimethylbenzimidazole phosphoribosyltransferase